MTLNDIVEVARALWPAWLMLVFIGIVAWAFWPRHRARLEGHAHIPLRDGEEER